MIIAWIGYCLLVSALLGLAALTIERALGHYRKPVRAVWVTALAGSVALPIVAYVAPALVARFATVTPAIPIELPGAFALADLTSASATGFDWSAVLATTGLVLGSVWLLSIIAFAGYLAVAHRRLRRDMAGWTPGEILEAPVLMTRDVGPAVVGFGKAVIVMPAWISELDEDVLRLVFMHEREHLLAGDNRLFALGLLSLAAMPWNPIAWWQLRRLRIAIEFDCDRRVMARGVEPREYAEALLAVGGRLTSAPLAAAAFAERRPAVERRLRRMTEPLRRLRGPRALAGMGVGMLAVLFACGSPLPTDTADADALAGPGADAPAEPKIVPKFIPYDVPPMMQNRAEMTEALDEFYPAALRAERLGGRTELWVYLDEHGEVANQMLKTSSSRKEFDEAAVAVLARAEYSPATNQGVPTGVWFSQWITFQDEGVTMLEPVQTSKAPPPTGPDPLYIVDGVIVAKADIPKLAKESVESVEILKADAALSRYGERGKNGVVRITTKEGAVDADVPSEMRQREPARVERSEGRLDRPDGAGFVTKGNVRVLESDGQPLIVIDGVIQAADVSLEELDAADIDHVEIIKGEAARSLYGERGRNGVVQIVTKSGG